MIKLPLTRTALRDFGKYYKTGLASRTMIYASSCEEELKSDLFRNTGREYDKFDGSSSLLR